MRGRLIHQRYEVYVDGTLVTGRNAVVVDDRKTQTLSIRERNEPTRSFSEVEVLEESRSNRESRFTYMALDADGNTASITAVRKGCGCGR